jgi:hypothetical protein
VTSTTDATSAPLVLQPEEQAVLIDEVGPFADTLRDPGLRARYQDLARAVEAGQVPADLVGLVEALAELVLPTQRLRRRHGPEAERVLTALYHRTPLGQARRAATQEVNDALMVLHGQTLQEIVFAPTIGGQRLSLTTPQGRLDIVIDRGGVRVERVELGSVV